MQDVNDILKSNGFKITIPRKVILQFIYSQKKPVSAEDLIKKNICDQATIFRTLKQLVKKGVLQELYLTGERTYYQFNSSHKYHHHHLICDRCKNIIPLDICSLGPMLKEAQRLGFKVLSHQVCLTGLCGKCLNRY